MLPSFAYYRPGNLKEACKAVRPEGSWPWAGGTDLLGCLRELRRRGFRNLVQWTRGVDTELFRPRGTDVLGVARPVFMYVGRVAVEKGLDDFLRLSLPGTKVVVITAYGTVNSAVEAMKLGVVDFIQKPFSGEEIRELVGRVVDQRKLNEHKAETYQEKFELAKRMVQERRFEAAAEWTRGFRIT